MRTSWLWLSVFCLLASVFSLATSSAAPATQPSIEQKTQAMLDQWKERFGQEKLNWIISPPFLLAGDGTPGQLKSYRDGTVLSAHRALSAMYFKAQPSEPIMILLLESARPYERISKDWFKIDDPSHFGYCMHNGIMVMNVSTGMGTLVHEMVHALVKPDFPTIPTWFNEGLGSLYEQSQVGEKSIKGLVNWRVPTLQNALRDKSLRPLTEMIEDPDFYNEESRGLNYAYARYLLMYLQEKGLLKDYYAQFRDGVDKDPTGIKTLKAVVQQDWAAFEKDWQAWVLTLRFRVLPALEWVN